MIRPTGAVFLLMLFSASSFVAGGCGSTTEVLSARQAAELDSMYAQNRELRQQLRVLRDSLQFYDDIDSGQYYRDRRILTQSIERLEYELGVCSDGGRTVETILADDLFAPATAEITEAGRALLATLADTLKGSYADGDIRVEGHADSTPIGGSLKEIYPSNWELSAARAGAVTRVLVDEHGIRADRVVMASYGSTRPVAPNDTAVGRTKNRRIRVAVMPR